MLSLEVLQEVGSEQHLDSTELRATARTAQGQQLEDQFQDWYRAQFPVAQLQAQACAEQAELAEQHPVEASSHLAAHMPVALALRAVYLPASLPGPCLQERLRHRLRDQAYAQEQVAGHQHLTLQDLHLQERAER